MTQAIFKSTYSKTRNAAKNYTRNAQYLELEQGRLAPAQFNGVTKVGSPGVEQLSIGVNGPTVNAAIEDIANAMVIPVNGILMTTEDVNPAGQSQIDLVQVTGTAVEDHIFVYGLKIPTVPGEDSEEVTTRIIDVFNQYSGQQVFDDITQINANTFEIKYMDMRPHEPLDITTNGITISANIQSEVRPGFGTWIKLGETEIVSGTDAYIWKRTS